MPGRDEDELAGLLQAAIAGDEKAYGVFLERTAVILRRFARRQITHGGVDPEDIVQETLLAIHLKRHTWHSDAAVMPWVYAIARFKLIDAFRRRGRRVEIDIDALAESLPEPEAETVSPREVGRALEALTPGQRSVVAAISVEGCSVAETAARLEMTEGAVRVTLHRGLAAIAKRFGRS